MKTMRRLCHFHFHINFLGNKNNTIISKTIIFSIKKQYNNVENENGVGIPIIL